MLDLGDISLIKIRSYVSLIIIGTMTVPEWRASKRASKAGGSRVEARNENKNADNI